MSRQWLYGQPELRAEIERRRAAAGRRPTRVPATERASDGSLRQRIATLVAETRRLREENQALKPELALAYGARRDAATAPSR